MTFSCSTSEVFQQVILIVSLFLAISSTLSSPPEDPITCLSDFNTNCTITNSYGVFPDQSSSCLAGSVAYPQTEKELVDIVSAATKNGRKMKVATRFSHSSPKLVCLDGEDGLLISTNYLNRIVSIDYVERTMTVESGVTLREVIGQAAKAGLALPYTPYWWGLTIGGMLGTGAHGSTLWGEGSSIHDYVIGMRIVSPGREEDGFVKVRRLSEGDQDLNAAKVSLGVLGVISQVTLKLQPNFKRSITFVTENDNDLGDRVAEFGIQHEFADITWYPSQKKAIYRIDNRVSSNFSGNGLNDFVPFRSSASLQLATLRALEESQELTRNAESKCTVGNIITSTLALIAYGYTNNGLIFTGYPIIGNQHRLQASGSCLDSPDDGTITACPWDPRVKGEFFHQTAISISLKVAKEFIKDVQQLVERKPKALCGLDLYNGILIRYVKTSSAYLGKQENSVDFDITYYRSKNPLIPRLYEDIIEEIEQIAVFKYGGLPHWAKNRNIAFEGVIDKYRNGGKFLRVKKEYDPLGLFSSEWTDQVLGVKGNVSIYKKGCALEGLCICSIDSHCAPARGYFCRPGKIYKDASVCTRVI